MIRIFFALAALFIIVSDSFAADRMPQTTCTYELTGALSSSRLGIGVLVRDSKGEMQLGVSPYAGSIHDNIVYELLDRTEVDEIVWMGEVRYTKLDHRVELHEANETSGFYSRHANSALSRGGRQVAVRNSVQHLYDFAQSQNFHAYSYESGKNFRLAEELRDVRGDVRHSIGNSLAVLRSATSLMTNTRMPFERKDFALQSLKGASSSHLRLVSWLIDNLIEDERISAQDIEPLRKHVRALLNPNFKSEDFLNIDSESLCALVDRVAAYTVPGKYQAKIEIFRLGPSAPRR